MAEKVESKKTKKVFVISPVRGISDEESLKISNYILGLRQGGIDVYWPPVDTDQTDQRGTVICEQNFEAINRADEVHIYWSEKSEGSRFDFGMVFALGKRIVLINRSEVEKMAEAKSGKCFEKVLLDLAEISEDVSSRAVTSHEAVSNFLNQHKRP